MPTLKGRFTDPDSGASYAKDIAVDEAGRMIVHVNAVGVALDIQDTAADLPSPSVDYEGVMRYVQESGSTHATMRVCMRTVAGSYSWVTVATGQ